MNPDSHDLIQRHMAGLLTEDEAAVLQTRLKADTDLRRLYLHYMNLDVALEAQAGSRDRVINLLRTAPLSETKPAGRWYSWRPLTAAVAGIVFGMFCTSVVFGFVAQRSAVKRTQVPVFDPGFEVAKPLDTGIPHRSEEWGVRSAQVTKAERNVQPRDGGRMLRMEPVLESEADDNFSAGAYQVLDLSQMPRDNMTSMVEAEVTAAFAAAGDDKARYIMRVFALDEAPESAARDFWTKADKAEVVSMTQRFEAPPAADGWQSYSVKIPVPSSARSLVIVISVLVLRHTSTTLAPHYLDDVHVSLIQHSNH